MTTITDISNAKHYLWGDGCSGWYLLQRDDLSVIEEYIPSGQSEKPHFHKMSRQFFYILQGEAVLEIEGNEFVLQAYQGIEVPPNAIHQFRNVSDSGVRFLVISMPKAHGDRVET